MISWSSKAEEITMKWVAVFALIGVGCTIGYAIRLVIWLCEHVRFV